MERSVQSMFADYLRMVADWRKQRYQDDLRDRRNLQSAAALNELADHVLTLDDDDARLHDLERVSIEGNQFIAGQQTAYEIGRFHFFDINVGFEAFLDRVVELAKIDANEHGHFGGPQVPGDEPWR